PTMPHMYPLLPGCPPSVRERTVRPDRSRVRPDTWRSLNILLDQYPTDWHGVCVPVAGPTAIAEPHAKPAPHPRHLRTGPGPRTAHRPAPPAEGVAARRRRRAGGAAGGAVGGRWLGLGGLLVRCLRSEEHTSELQSRENL